ncbi:MAG: M20/M25/M40 family metallo-hydrolase [Clostridia bacterium]|nr:M20/M25/M40 family metallo-hydrolase [Clostridia bacterium]
MFEVKDRIKQLAAQCGLSGAESSVACFLCEELKKLGMLAERDPYGNVYGRFAEKKKGGKTLLLEAHMDQIGLMVSDIGRDGYVKFVNLGGVDQRILPGMEVTIWGSRSVYGIVGAFTRKSKDEEDAKNPKIEEYRIDTGLTEAEVKAAVSVGDFIQLKGATTSLLNEKMSGCAMDNRAGIAAILRCLQRLSDKSSPYEIHVLFSTQEELGLHGAYTGLKGKKIDAAIVVDVTHGTTCDCKEEIGVFPLGCGAVICRGPNFHYEYTKQLISLAKEKNVSHEIEVASAESGTTAWAIQTANGGIPVMLVSIPLRYMHTNVETLALSDVNSVSELLYHAAMGGVVLA